jgi:beta-lactamase class A
MTHRSTFWRALAALVLLPLLAACTSPSAATIPTPEPTAAPTPQPSATPSGETHPVPTPTVWVFPEGSRIAGVDVSGRTAATAIKLVSLGISQTQQPIPLALDPSTADADTPAVRPWNVGVALDVPATVLEAAELADAGQPVDIAWTPQVDESLLRAELESLAELFNQEPVTDVLLDEEAYTSTFTFRANDGVRLDAERTAALIAPLLLDRSRAMTETVVLDVTPRERDLAELERVLREHMTYWSGVAGIYVHDLETGEELAINADSVFSGASVMKVPIMLFTYARLGEFTEQQREWMESMILDSDNLDANALLAAAVGGQGTEAALKGVNEMSAMLEDLGLEHTYMLIPYESGEWLIQQSRLPQGGPEREGRPPFTAADRHLRTTPREMGTLFVWLAQCAEGEGPLLEELDGALTQALCEEMIGWLDQGHDPERMLAGIPDDVRVAHKGGWIDDMQSDVGIVYSPGGRYVAAIYVYRPDGYVTNIHATPSPYLGDFSHTIYTFFNPEPLD